MEYLLLIRRKCEKRVADKVRNNKEEPRQFEHRSSEENAIPEEDDILLAVAAKRLKDADLTKAIPEAEAYKELGIKPGDLAGTEETDIE